MARVNEAECQKFGVPCRFLLARVNRVYATRQVFVVCGIGATAKGHFLFWREGGRVTSGRRSEPLLITPNAFELKYRNCSNELRSELQSIALTKSRSI